MLMILLALGVIGVNGNDDTTTAAWWAVFSDDASMAPVVTETPAPSPTERPEPGGASSAPDEPKYIGNKNSDIFHYSWCSSVMEMSEKNKVPYNSRNAAKTDGYRPCKRCNP